jgi:NAD+ kinase
VRLKKIGIIGKPRVVEVIKMARDLVNWLEQMGVEAWVEEAIAERSEGLRGLPREEIAERADLMVVMGGDGTLLSAARLVASKGIPLLGVNAGGLGFLTEITMEELFSVMEELLRGDVRLTTRTMLDASVVRDGTTMAQHKVLNDVVVNKGALARIIDLETYINDEYLTTFKADGLIVSSPAGSTAYNLSAGGPIVYPSLRSIILTPICPHTLTNRPILLPDDVTVKICVGSVDKDVYITFDGQVGYQVEEGDRVMVRIASQPLKLIKSPHRSFFEVLRSKLHWGER